MQEYNIPADFITEIRVLILSPHADDAEIGCGASILKHIENGIKVKVLAFANRRDTDLYASNEMKQEFYNSMNLLGVEEFEHLEYKTRCLEENLAELTDLIYKTIKEYRPDILYIPSLNSRHEDHVAIAMAGYRASGRLEVNVLGYHVIGDGINFKPTYFEVVEKRHALKRIEALHCYDSQYKLRPFFSDGNFEASLVYYSSMTGYDLVEPFEVVKWIKK